MDDLQGIFRSAQDVGDVWMYAADMYASMPPDAIKPGASRTEVIVVSVMAADLKNGVSHDLPGGYNKLVGHIKDNVRIYGIKYVEPGKDIGFSLNAFFKVNGHWVLIPKTWRAFEE